ncbi:MAG: RNA-binding protein, partial [Nanoarchaeota archaeon]
MSKKLYVGNLPYSVNGEKLKELFAAYGEIVESTVISFRDTGKSKGFGFVTLADDAQADKAVQEMNG